MNTMISTRPIDILEASKMFNRFIAVRKIDPLRTGSSGILHLSRDMNSGRRVVKTPGSGTLFPC